MTPESFVAKWSKSELKERSACQEHFLDLCHLVGHPTPAEADPTGESFCFERFAEKVDGSDGYADVWKRGCFAIEYKGKRKDLGAAYDQLLLYREDLENPPLLAVCDTDRLVIHTNFTNTAKRTYELNVANLADPGSLELLRALFFAPEKLKPGTTVAFVSEQAARKVAALAQALEGRGVEPMRAAQFLMKLVFALFAEDADLLPEKLVEGLLDQARKKPALARPLLEKLFSAMRDGDEGLAFTQEIAHFNGGLFEDASALDLEAADLEILRAAAVLDWSAVDPAIFGNLYEYGLGADSRSKRGVHYTSREDILHLIEPVLLRPWKGRWAALKAEVEARLAERPSKAVLGTLQRRVEAFRESLGQVEVLDPACGSGNFLVVAMQRLLDLELEVVRFQAERFHTQALSFQVGPQQLHGIEILAFPHALASVVVWIGHLQWLRQHGYRIQERPILKKLQPIVQGDSLDLPWPKVEAIIGNPPFIGGKRLRAALGDPAVDALFVAWDGRVPREADYVCYWFEKARAAVVAGEARRVGLLATNSIRQGKNRVVLEKILADSAIFFAESDREWVLEGAAVRVSMVGFGNMEAGEGRSLDGQPVAAINPDLTSSIDLSKAARLAENAGISFMGDTKVGPFDIPGVLARSWMALPLNPNGRPNRDVLKPWANGIDVTRRPQDLWIIDFGVPPDSLENPIPGMPRLTEVEASYFEAPFQYAELHVKPMRKESRTGKRAWWVHERPRPEMRAALCGLTRFLVTPCVSKHRVFAWMDADILPDHKLIAFVSAKDGLFGLLHSRMHEIWALASGSWHGVGNDPSYTPNTTFETFPFPPGWQVPGKPQASADPDNQSFIGVHRCSSVANPSLPPVVEKEKSEKLDNHRCTPMNTDQDQGPRPSPVGGPGSSVANPSLPPVVENEKSEKLDNHRCTPMNTDQDQGPRPSPVGGPGSSVANPALPVVAEAARLLDEARERWLNPEGASEAELKKRTLTALYNAREAGQATWLNHLHRDLDRAVLAAYGWSDLAEPLFAAEDALRAANPKGDALGLALSRTEPGQALLGRLLALNLGRSAAVKACPLPASEAAF